MTAAELHAGDHLQGMLPPVPGIRADYAIPVVAHAIVRRRNHAPYRVDVRWSDGTGCSYPPEHVLHVLPAAVAS